MGNLTLLASLVFFIIVTIVAAMIEHDTPLGVINFARLLTRLGQRLQPEDERQFADVLDDFDNNALLVRNQERSIWWLLLHSVHFAGREGMSAVRRLELPRPIEGSSSWRALKLGLSGFMVLLGVTSALLSDPGGWAAWGALAAAAIGMLVGALSQLWVRRLERRRR